MPVPPGAGRLLVLGAAFVCAACGLVYELELVALASYLSGDSVTQASLVLSVMVFAMGLGSLLAKRLRGRAAAGFGAVEAALALTGGASAMALHAAFAWLGASRPVLVGFSLAIGVLIGAEVPLLMTLIQRVRRQDAGGAVADLFAADYVGALVGGLAFPFLLLPCLGQLTGALVTGAVNVIAGGALVLWLFRGDLGRRARWWLLAANACVLALLAAGTVLADDFERAARQAVYGDDVRVALHTGVQDIVLTGPARGPADIYVDGRLRAGGRAPHRYHETLVHPAMAGGPRRHVLVLGGGDGLAAAEVLRYGDVSAVTVVDPDPAMVRLAGTDPALRAMNGEALADPRVRVRIGDVFGWLRKEAGRKEADRAESGRTGPGALGPGVLGPERAGTGGYDVVVADLPDPSHTAAAKLYSQEFYGLAARVLRPGGRLAVHTGATKGRPGVLWTADATVRAAGLRTLPYTRHDRGFLLAARARPRAALAPRAPRLRTLTVTGLERAVRAAGRQRIEGMPPSTLVHPRYGV
ncbi:polyamine aminopropyltransferase [Streptomyces sp. GC420]|uniref:polyamine aminopropyltransferase n=1 Tax=Streptomyces sp. GC420 TaxID=2697568 RepID=UPI001AA0DDAD|nr:polyamine aminopropyltransferase [Streptomyces sp. GC420]